MKKTILSVAISILFIGAFITSCQTPESKVEDAEEKVVNAEQKLDDANFDLNQARLDSIQQWKEETAVKISNNDKSIAELKAKILKLNAENKANYDKSLAALELKNAELKKKLGDYNYDGKSNWQIFKDEFNRDLEEIAKSFKDLTVKNTK